jgi:hypothetical protein
MKTETQEWKIPIRAFYRQHSTETLCRVLAGCKDKKIHFLGCCCYIGATTADHAFGTGAGIVEQTSHYYSARLIPHAISAELAIQMLGASRGGYSGNAEALRRSIVIAIIRAILKEREHEVKIIQAFSNFVHIQDQINVQDEPILP